MLRSVYFNIFPYFSPSLDAKNNIRFYKKENCTMYLFWEICILNANNVLIILQHCCVKITKWKMQFARLTFIQFSNTRIAYCAHSRFKFGYNVLIE